MTVPMPLPAAPLTGGPIARLWRSVPSAYQRWLILNGIFGIAVVNIFGNALSAIVGARSQSVIPLWVSPLSGKTCTLTDAIGTLFVLPFLTTVGVTRTLRREQSKGRLPSITLGPWASAFTWLPDNMYWRGVVNGLITMVVFTAGTALVVVDGLSHHVTRESFVVAQVIYGTSLGLIVAPIVTLANMAKLAAEPTAARG